MARTDERNTRRRLRLGLAGLATGIATALMLIGAHDAALARPLPRPAPALR